MNKEEIVLGIDIGASGIKGALVNVTTGKLITERHRVPTPQPATPDAIGAAFRDIAQHFDWSGAIGCGFPAIIKDGVVCSAANIAKEWIGVDAQALFSKYTNCNVYICNDADVAGMAEMRLGVGLNKQGTVIMITIGTGLGSAVFIDGLMLPNTELGHLYLQGQDDIAERYAADSIRKKEDLKWKVWGKRFNEYLHHLELLFTPNLFILGGGSSKRFENYSEFLTVNAPVIPAKLLNNAGIIGASIYAYERKRANLAIGVK